MARTKQHARIFSRRARGIKRARKEDKKVSNSFCNKPKKGVLLSFNFELADDTDISEDSECSDNDDQITYKKYSVGDDDIVFDIKVTTSTTERELIIELISCSQKHSVVHLVQCQAVIDVDTYDGTMEPLHFQPMTFSGHKNSVRVSKDYDELIASVELPSIFISGSIMYEEPPLKMQQEISTLLTNDENSDVHICVGEMKKKFAAHKCLLAARSSFFQAMFSVKMRESVENIVNLSEDSPELFEQMLQYIYTDTCSKLSEMPADLLVFADKYDVKGLLQLCEDEMKKTMNTRNVCDYLKKSGMINAKEVYDKCFRFIRRNNVVVTKTAGWAKLKEMSEQNQSHKFLEDVIQEIEK